MRKLLLVLAGSVLLSGQAQAFDFNDDVRSVSTKGVCFATVSNDRVKIKIKVSNIDRKSSEVAFNKTKASSSDLDDYIKELNIVDLKLDTTAINIFEEKEWSSARKEQVFKGYKAEIMTTVDIPMTQKQYMGLLINKISTYSGVYLDSFSTYVSQSVMEDVKTDCLSKAVKNAKIKASKMATAGGAILDKLLRASFESVNTPRPRYMDNVSLKTMAFAESASAEPININSKDEEVKVEVSTIWEIK